MRIRKSVCALSGATWLALTGPALAQSQQETPTFGNLSCSQIQNDMRSELSNLNLDQSVQERVDNILRQARQNRNEEQCLRTLRQANSIISRETGESPIASARFRQALQEARSARQSGTRQASDRPKGQEVRPTSSLSESDSARIPVTFSSNLIGRSVKDSRGDSAGQIEYLVVDTKTGDVRFAVIGSGGFLDIGEELTAVPWDKVQVRTWGTNSEPHIWLHVSLDKLEQGRRITHDRLAQLANPSFQTQIVTFYLPVEVSDTGQGRSTQNQSQKGRQAGSNQTENNDRISDSSSSRRFQQDRPARSGQTDKSFDGPAETQQADRQTERSRDSAQTNQDRSAQGQSGRQQRSASVESHREQTLLLVGRELITTLSPSQLRTGQQIKGATVETSDGREVGEIDRLVIDVERGKVAYALVAKGGFLGIGEEWRPVPLTALSWQIRDVYTLGQGQSQLEKMPTLSSDDLPSRIRQGDLKKLYQSYSIPPYWVDDNRSSPQTRDSNQ